MLGRVRVELAGVSAKARVSSGKALHPRIGLGARAVLAFAFGVDGQKFHLAHALVSAVGRVAEFLEHLDLLRCRTLRTDLRHGHTLADLHQMAGMDERLLEKVPAERIDRKRRRPVSAGEEDTAEALVNE